MGVFHVSNPEIERRMNEVGQLIQMSLPEGWGFSLLIFDFDNAKTDGGVFYVSNAQRADMLVAMREFIANVESEED